MKPQIGWVGIIHPEHGALHWHRKGEPEDYQAEAAKQGAEARKVKASSQVPEDYNSAITVDARGEAKPFTPPQTPEQKARAQDIADLEEIRDSVVPPVNAQKTLARILLKLYPTN